MSSLRLVKNKTETLALKQRNLPLLAQSPGLTPLDAFQMKGSANQDPRPYRPTSAWKLRVGPAEMVCRSSGESSQKSGSSTLLDLEWDKQRLDRSVRPDRPHTSLTTYVEWTLNPVSCQEKAEARSSCGPAPDTSLQISEVSYDATTRIQLWPKLARVHPTGGDWRFRCQHWLPLHSGG